MNPAIPTRLFIENRAASPIAGNAARVSDPDGDKKLNEFCRLLKHHTADEFHSVLRGHRSWQKQLGISLIDQSVPEVQWTDGLATWLLSNRETAAFIAFLKMVGSESVALSDRTGAETLLEAVRSTTTVTGLEVVLALSSGDAQADRDIIAPLAAAFKVNNGLDTLQITFTGSCPDGLALLTDALCVVKKLRLGMIGMAFDTIIFTLLTDLFSRNKEIHSFVLRHPCFLGTGPTPEYTAAMNTFLGALKAQGSLQCLRVDGVPQSGQKALADFIAQSPAITNLHLSLHGDVCTQPLVAALAQNTTITDLALTVPSIEDGMLSVIRLIADNKCRVTHFYLGKCYGRQDNGDVRVIGEMLSRNTTLRYFKWDVTSSKFFDLVLLGESLGKNTTLESIIIKRQHVSDLNGLRGVESFLAGQIPDFVTHLSKNRSLTHFEFFPNSSASIGRQLSDPAIDNIIKRNLSYQNYACSEGFIHGASCGFLETLECPPELGHQVAPYLMEQRPRIKAGPLALVNKATYNSALSERRKEGAKLIDQVLSPRAGNSEHATATMIALLSRMAVLLPDYSVWQVFEIACSRYLAPALVRMRSRDEFAWLVALFSDAVGPELMNWLMAVAEKELKALAAGPSG